ncbi:HEAT repeat family protein [Histomonas meleagridis]|uniref:HEAT repeat family protein n=1 Tax=Histomonas meleagridis TaxID=135588 RepID=UPI003559DE7D|nr:HEAT repeat family protein [Histomonas meleagridis]KAH0796663.1 HEAT repeat family protein [Histomonas meleagridis]
MTRQQQADPSFVLNFFIEELNSDNVNHRLFAANNISLVAAAMGPEHARNELMQYLMSANQLDGEVQMYLASCFGSLIKYVGGPEYCHVLLGPLKVLASAEESIVRDKAIESMGVVCESIPQANADSNLMSTCKDLANAEFFTARSSACAFAIKVYSKVNDSNKAILRTIYKGLCKDETPMVRRSALKYLPQLCEFLPPNIIIGEIAKDILSAAVNDDEDSVRLLVPATLSVISGKLNENDRNALIISLLKIIIKDGSWRVRSSLANELPAISKPFTAEVIMNEICPILFRLMRDPEAETKATSVKTVSGILPLLKGNESFIADKFIPEFSNLAKDGAPQVRREVSLRLMELASVIDHHNTNESIVPLFIKILRDNDNEASVALLTSLLTYADKIDLAAITPPILPVILEIAGETHWRVKVVIIKLIPSFAHVLGLDEFSRKLFPLVTSWLTDSIYSVRDHMSKQLGALVQQFGVDWCVQTLAPVILQFKKHQNYLIRQVTLMCVTQLHGFVPMNVLIKYFLPVVLQMSTDRVVNVKFMVAKTLLLFVGTNEPKVNQQIQICLKTLSNDPDTDVKYFACMALLKCQ